jgi:hypothetical protein
VSTDNSGHRQAVPGLDSDDDHWASHWARQDFAQVGQFHGGRRIRLMAI